MFPISVQDRDGLGRGPFSAKPCHLLHTFEGKFARFTNNVVYTFLFLTYYLTAHSA